MGRGPRRAPVIPLPPQAALGPRPVYLFASGNRLVPAIYHISFDASEKQSRGVGDGVRALGGAPGVREQLWAEKTPAFLVRQRVPHDDVPGAPAALQRWRRVSRPHLPRFFPPPAARCFVQPRRDPGRLRCTVTSLSASVVSLRCCSTTHASRRSVRGDGWSPVLSPWMSNQHRTLQRPWRSASTSASATTTSHAPGERLGEPSTGELAWGRLFTHAAHL